MRKLPGTKILPATSENWYLPHHIIKYLCLIVPSVASITSVAKTQIAKNSYICDGLEIELPHADVDVLYGL